MNRVSIGSDNGVSPIRPSGTNFSEILIKIQNFSFTKMQLKISSAKWRPFCPGGEELRKSKALSASRSTPQFMVVTRYVYCVYYESYDIVYSHIRFSVAPKVTVDFASIWCQDICNIYDDEDLSMLIRGPFADIN